MNLGQEACVKYAEDGIIGSEAKLELCFFPLYFIQDNRYNNVQTFIYRHGQRGYQKIACLYYCAVRHSLIVASYSDNILFGTKNRCWS